MYKQELPLLYPDDADVKKVQAAFFDPFEYLWLRHKGGALNTRLSPMRWAISLTRSPATSGCKISG